MGNGQRIQIAAQIVKMGLGGLIETGRKVRRSSEERLGFRNLGVKDA